MGLLLCGEMLMKGMLIVMAMIAMIPWMVISITGGDREVIAGGRGQPERKEQA